ncbi:MAG: DUF2357 domain-containing protein [Umezawaea sp.]
MSDRIGAPDPLVIASVVDIAHVLRTTGTLATWSGANMFVPDTSERAALSELDIAVLNEIDVLADVCARPHDRLDRTYEVIRADLARRVPAAGLARLAGHPEDWAGVERGRIHPLRVLSQRYTEDVDFYENRVTAQLVDRIGDHLTRRIRELSTLADGLADLDEYDRALHRRQSWRRLDRVARLIAQAVSDTTASASVIAESRTRLLGARARLRALEGTPVLKRANRRARVPMRLMRTNLFTDDRRYRRVGALWEFWATREVEALRWLEEAERGFSDAYQNYVAALSMRALAILGYTPTDSTARVPSRGSTVLLGGRAGEVQWSVGGDGAILLASGERELVRILPIGDDLGSVVTEQVRQRWFDGLADLAGSTIVVYPGLRAGRSALTGSLRKLAHPAGFGAGACVVPVSPLEIEGEERLARALRWRMQGARFIADYPLELKLSAPAPQRDGEWFRKVGPRRVVLLRRPSVDEQTGFVSAVSGTGAGSPRAVEKSRADLAFALVSATVGFDLFETCPVCHTGRAEVRARDQDTFHCRCSDCDAEWGTRICGRCSERYPVLWPLNAVADSADGDRLDVTAGADVLAVACVAQAVRSGSRFRCPWCGHCAGSPGCGCPPA